MRCSSSRRAPCSSCTSEHSRSTQRPAYPQKASHFFFVPPSTVAAPNSAHSIDTVDTARSQADVRLSLPTACSPAVDGSRAAADCGCSMRDRLIGLSTRCTITRHVVMTGQAVRVHDKPSELLLLESVPNHPCGAPFIALSGLRCCTARVHTRSHIGARSRWELLCVCVCTCCSNHSTLRQRQR